MIAEQDKQLDGVIRVVKDTKHVGEEFDTTIRKQNKQIEQLNEKIDRKFSENNGLDIWTCFK